MTYREECSYHENGRFECGEFAECYGCPGLYERAKELWSKLGDIPINDDEEIEETFLDFPAGTDKFDIWSWFEEQFNLSVAIDLMHLEEGSY